MKVVLAICFTATLSGYFLFDSFDPGELRGKHVIVTGASTGIGEQIAYHYARLGANVVAVARREARLKEVTQKCKELSASDAVHDYIAADLADLGSLEQITQTAIDKLHGKIDILVLNHALILPFGEWLGSSENRTTLDKVVDVNYKANVLLVSYLLPHLEKTSGQLIVMSSVIGRMAVPYQLPYVSSKFALEGFFAGLRQELVMKQSKISITVCAIGAIATERAHDVLREFGLQHLTYGGADPGETALAIIRGGALRQREVFYPYLQTKVITILRNIIPGVLEFASCQLYDQRVS